MPFTTPDVKALATRAMQAFRGNLKGSDAFLWPNNVFVSAKVIAGAVWESFSFLEYISRQIFAHTADGSWIDRHAYEYGMARLPASYASGQVTMTGTNGTTVPVGLVLQRADGLRYTVTGGGIVAAGSVTLTVMAETAGKTGNASAGVGVTLIAPFAGLDSAGTVAEAGIGSGADVEGDESLRARVLFRKRNPPHGGAVHDYVMWAREINGVTRVFVDPVTVANGRTSVGVYFMMDDTYAAGIPHTADVAAVAAYIDTQRPAGARVVVSAPVAQGINITITGLSPDTTEVREAVLAELADLFRREGRVSTLTEPFTIYRSKIWEAISIAAGEEHHIVTAPANDTTLITGRIPVLGAVTFA